MSTSFEEIWAKVLDDEQHILNLAADDEYIPASPAAGKKVPLYKTPKGRMRVLTEKEELKVYAAATPWLTPLIKFAINTVMRRGEMLSLRWEQVDRRAREIHLDKTKNGEPRDVPISDVVEDVLRRQGPKDSGYVFTMNGKPILGSSIHYNWRRAIERAGIPYCRWHDLRHTGCTRLILSGVDIRTVAEIAGHKDIQTTMGYTHPTRDSKRDAMARLGSYCTRTANL